MIALWKEHVDTFAWSCQDMPGSDTDVVVHKLSWRGDCPLEKQNAGATYQSCSPTETVYAGSYHFVDFKMDLITYISGKSASTGRVARWQVILTECDIQYTSQKAMKGSVLSGYLA
ncbi:hypothetical protein KIW84_032226 [Lathyrus oleraceus]|uniref:Uncharacterized protein n=1 Tax=Pisum sativum TaxID=3888 RepID=A0A9D5B1E0_PEA|nr:hypothetical protein KIW84_032226 [Pisum sativum]